MRSFSVLCFAPLFLSATIWPQANSQAADPKTVQMKLRKKWQGETLIDQYPFSFLRDIDDPVLETDTPFFWHIPKASGSNLKHVMGTCLGKISASGDGSHICGDPLEENELKLCHTPYGTFVNVENGNMIGVHKSQEFGVIESGLAEVVVGNKFRTTSYLFNRHYGGRAFAIFRDPIERIVSTFYYLGKATWERTYNPSYAEMTILDYAKRHHCPQNWMTRNILGKLHDPAELTEDDLDMAKEILRRKVFVLLSEDLETSVRRLISYLGWEIPNADAEKCVRADIGTRINNSKYPKLEEGSEAWNIIVNLNQYDIKLYEYAKQLFYEEQQSFEPRSLQRSKLRNKQQ